MTTTIELTAAEFRTLLASRRPDVAMYSEFKESEHPRADDGKFATAAGTGGDGHKTSESNGTEKQTVQKSSPTEDELQRAKSDYESNGTESHAFKKWFGGSKVVDAEGKPLVVYHGTDADFDQFENSSAVKNAAHVGKSFYFTDDATIASEFASKSGGNVKPVYLAMKNPLDFDSEVSDSEVEKWAENVRKYGASHRPSRVVDAMKKLRDYNDRPNTGFDLWKAIAAETTRDNANEIARAMGYDGIVHRSTDIGGSVADIDTKSQWGRVYIPFEPNQIKSAIGNRGTFDPKDERMNYALVRQFNGAIARYGIREDIEAAAAATHTEPTEAQKKAGNYAKGKFRLHGLEIAIETPAGAVRRGKDANGKEWEHEMPHHYGYILRTESEADGDHVDVFIGPDPHCELAFVVDQRKPSKRFDEHKVMLGWRNEAAARKAYLAAYTDGWTGFMGITPMTIPDLREWLRKGDTSKPVAKYALAHGLFEDAIAKYDDWITIGGRPEGGKQHAGGTPVQIDGAGRITKGPAALRNRSLSNVDRNVQRPAAPPPAKPQQTEQPAPKPEQTQPNPEPPKAEEIDPLADLRKRLAVQTTYKVKIRKSDETALRQHGMDSRKAAYIMGAQSHATAEIWKPGAKNCFAMSVIKGQIDGVEYEMNRRMIIDEMGMKVLKNDYFILHGKNSTGKGIGMKIFGQQVDAAIESGISRIETIACRSDEFEETQYNGYYTWARFGYDAPLSSVNLKQPLPESLKQCVNVSDLMKTAEGRNWWKENGNTFAGKFDLSEGSQSRKVLDAYRQQKAAAASG